jgi:hypothetical protein
MSAARRRALVLAIVAPIAAAALTFLIVHGRDAPTAKPPTRRPPLMLLTSLPLIFNEGFSLNGGGSPVLKALESRYRVVAISTTDPRELSNAHLLLMAHAPAQTAENLVALDEWVRGGGRVMLLADPLVEWPGERPLRDPLRPASMFTDTGLLAHWGLRLDGPDRRGFALRLLGGRQVMTASPGRLSGSCAVSRDGFVGYCQIGRGRAIVLADADFLNVGGLPPGGERNLDALLGELANLESR